VLVDLAVTYRVPGWLAGLGVTGVVYAAALVQDLAGLLPPWSWWSALPVAVGFAVLWETVDRIARSAAFARWRQPVEPGAGFPGADGGASAAVAAERSAG
jgi:4-hydroxybenzoate polyprenyltransferase